MAESKMAESKMAAMCELSELRLSLSLWYEFECSFCGILCILRVCDCDVLHVSNVAESKMVDIKMAAMCELSELRLSLILWFDFELFHHVYHFIFLCAEK